MPQKTREIVLDLDSPDGYNGLGDVVSLAWLAETAKQANTSFSFFSKDPNKIKLLSLFQQKYADSNKDAISTASLYKAEIECACNKPRLELLKEAFGVLGCGDDIRPEHSISDASLVWAENTYSRVINIKSKFVMLFPSASFKSRQYPLNYWCEIAWKLHNNNIACAVFDTSYSDTFEKFPLWFYGVNLEDLAALVKRADLVVGNDSFPANLSGALGTPTIALMGPTSTNVFKHMPDITTLASSQMPCTGCHFGKPFRSCCDLGCQSLFRLFPDEVLKHIYRMLNQEQQGVNSI
jgi:hypothetical protein